jgi:hypothetical protein
VSRCAHCGKATGVLVGMDPGRDRQEWFLCVRCWRDGLHPMTLVDPPAPKKASRR